MFTINLEEALVKQNENRILLPKELLEIKEYERLGSTFCNDKVIGRLGLNAVAKNGRERKKYEVSIKKYLKKYNPEKVYHISQIESLCKKYRLRFLPIHRYKGSVDSLLAKKVSNFEVAYEDICTDENCMIAAPKSSFHLEARPKDPLFFYKINSEYFYLIHKWGNDLSVFRQIKVNKILSTTLFVFGVYVLYKFITGTLLYEKYDGFLVPDIFICILITGVWALIVVTLYIAFDDNWNSKIE